MNIHKNKPLSFRHENKYLIDASNAEILRSRLATLLRRDEHTGEGGIYKIRSLYFDDYWNSAYEEKFMGVSKRFKYRIRVYNDSDDIIRLERKLKREAYIAKQSAPLTRDETERLMDGDYDFLRDSPHILCKEFYYECVTRYMRPRVIVDYDREPFVYEAGDVRITFDMNLRASTLRYDIFDENLPSIHVMDPGHIILEVKFTEFIPGFLREMLPHRVGSMESLSKYTMVCDRLAHLSVNPSY